MAGPIPLAIVMLRKDFRRNRKAGSLQNSARRAGSCALPGSVHRQPAHLVEQRAEADAEQAGGLAAFPARRFQRPEDRLALDGLDLGLQVERTAVGIRKPAN